MGENIIMILSPMIIHANPTVDQGKRVLPWGIWRTSFNADDRGPPPPRLEKVERGRPTAFGALHVLLLPLTNLSGPLGGTPASVRAGGDL